MICPHCEEDTFDFRKLYWWQLGKKTCPKCKGIAEVKSNLLLGCLSGVLGLLSIVPVLLTDNLWMFMPSIIAVLYLDYLMDKKYRHLVPASAT